jgi:bacterioferritin
MATRPTNAVTSVERPARSNGAPNVTPERLVELLNEDLAREYQAIIAYVVYSQVIKGPEYMAIAAELEKHASEELAHALTIAKQIDYLGGQPTVTPLPVLLSDDPQDLLRFDLQNENETVHAYRDRVRQCESLGEFGMAEQIRQILVAEQDHQIDLATALGADVSQMTTVDERA